MMAICMCKRSPKSIGYAGSASVTALEDIQLDFEISVFLYIGSPNSCVFTRGLLSLFQLFWWAFVRWVFVRWAFVRAPIMVHLNSCDLNVDAHGVEIPVCKFLE